MYLRFLDLGAIYGITEVVVDALDDAVTGPISITPGFPFGSSIQTQFYVNSDSEDCQPLQICSTGSHSNYCTAW